MEIKEHHILVQRTARFYTVGHASAETTDLWFCCHGYGQLAASLIRKFEVLDPEKHFVVAPEGLSRFYWNGFGGKPVASWMTSEDRLNEIADYLNYLDRLYIEIRAKFQQEIRVNILGFSQGTATVTRWIANQKSRADNLILWAGPLASDVEWPKAKPVLDQLDLYFVYGNEDPFINAQQAEQHQNSMRELGIQHEVHRFDGPHKVDRQALLTLSNKIIYKKQV